MNDSNSNAFAHTVMDTIPLQEAEDIVAFAA